MAINVILTILMLHRTNLMKIKSKLPLLLIHASYFDIYSKQIKVLPFRNDTMAQNKQESRRKYWATHFSVCLFACTAHSFACSTLFAALVHSAALTRSHIHSFTHSLTHHRAHGKLNHQMAIFVVFFSALDHSE